LFGLRDRAGVMKGRRAANGHVPGYQRHMMSHVGSVHFTHILTKFCLPHLVLHEIHAIIH